MIDDCFPVVLSLSVLGCMGAVQNSVSEFVELSLVCVIVSQRITSSAKIIFNKKTMAQENTGGLTQVETQYSGPANNRWFEEVSRVWQGDTIPVTKIVVLKDQLAAVNFALPTRFRLQDF